MAQLHQAAVSECSCSLHTQHTHPVLCRELHRCTSEHVGCSTTQAPCVCTVLCLHSAATRYTNSLYDMGSQQRHSPTGHHHGSSSRASFSRPNPPPSSRPNAPGSKGFLQLPHKHPITQSKQITQRETYSHCPRTLIRLPLHYHLKLGAIGTEQSSYLHQKARLGPHRVKQMRYGFLRLYFSFSFQH